MILDARPEVGSSLPGERHRCLGSGRFAGICPVIIPRDRALCYFCAKTPDPIACPLCGGVLNEPYHMSSPDHTLAVWRQGPT